MWAVVIEEGDLVPMKVISIDTGAGPVEMPEGVNVCFFSPACVLRVRFALCYRYLRTVFVKPFECVAAAAGPRVG